MNTFLKTSLIGKINNLPHFKGEALLPIFEAVVNSIQSIEELDNISSGKVCIRIKRDSQMSLAGIGPEESKITGFEITDNGIGFNDVNFDSFLTSDTTHKIEKGCKGIGRFFWLKAFKRIEVNSVYEKNGEQRKRCFQFTKEAGIDKVTDIAATNLPHKTVIKLIDFQEEYRRQPSAYKTTSKIAQRILEHCLSYFIAGNAPIIMIEDDKDSFSLKNLFDDISKNIVTEDFEISKENFKISHIKLFNTHNKMHNLVLCGRSREVKKYNISSLLGTSTQFDDTDKKFIYSSYVSGDYLDNHVC